MNQRDRGRALSDEVRAALQGEQPKPRTGQGTATSGHHGVSVAGSGNQVHYYGAGSGGPPNAARGVWSRVWMVLTLAFFLMGLWLQMDFVAWHEASGDPALIRLIKAFSGGTVQDVIVPMLGGMLLGGALTLFLRYLWNRL